MPQRSEKLNKGYCLLTFESSRSAKKFCDDIKGLTLFGRELKA